MEVSEFYELWEALSESMTTKDKIPTMESYLTFLYENDLCDIVELSDYAESQDEDEDFIKEIKYFIRDNDLEEEEDY